jgi:phage gp29-like protein
MEAERHRIAGVAPPVTRYANLHTQVELETLEAKQNAVANAITKQIQDHFLNMQALSALEAQERKISELRMEFETKRKERLERFASAPVQKGCRWIECPEPFSLPGEAMLIKMRAENPNFDHPTEKVGKSKHR